MQKSITVKPAGLRKLEKLPVLLNGERPLPSDQLFNLLPHRDTLVTDFGKSVIEHSETSIPFNTLAIIEQPNAVSLYVGETLTISIRVLSNPACTYQLYKDGELVEGATSATYTKIADVLDSGVYYFILDNNFATVISNHVAVAVNEVPITVKTFTGGGYNFAMFLDADGDLYCTGYNAFGNYGNGTYIDSASFVKTATNAASAACQYAASFYITPIGELYAAGNSASGSLGLGVFPSDYPNWTITATNAVKIIAGSSASFYIDADNILYGVGRNEYGQLGLGNTSDVYTWTQSAENATNCYVTNDFSMYVDTNGILYAAGHLDDPFGIGDRSGVSNWTSIATGVVSACVSTGSSANGCKFFYIDTSSDLYGIGKNYSGELGLGDKIHRTEWTLTASNVESIASCEDYSMYLSTSGDLYATGENWTGQLGTGDTDARTTWTLVASNVASFALTHYGSSFYINTSGKLFGVGCNDHGVLGLGDDTPRLTWTEISIPE